MITPDDLTESAEIFDRVLERVARGVPMGREIHADEMDAFIRMAVLWRDCAQQLANDMVRIGAQSMGIGEGRATPPGV